jgi:peptidoglycan hydrolase-like protein with peptidoglycan-binding domain
MTTPADVLQKAVAQLGTTETPLGSNRTKYGVWYEMDGQPWCAMFVSYCFYHTGLPLPITTPKGFAYCPYGVQWFKLQNKLFHTPKVGDIVFYDWEGDGISDHVGIVESVNNNGTITAIEGNTSPSNNSNGGWVMRRNRSLNSVKGFGRPPYNGITTTFQVPPYPSWPGIYFTLTSPHTISNHVQKWQQQMIHRGWDLSPDDASGVFGERSYEVLKEFQEEKGLEFDGKLGPESWNAAWLLPITP